MQDVSMVDQTALKTGQATTILLLLLAFVIGPNAWWLVAAVALAQLAGALALPFAPYRLLYRALRAVNLLKPNPQPDHPQPHRFAMAVGTIFNAAGAILLLTGSTVAGWALVWIVIALANLNFWAGFCLGCWMYYQFNRFGVPGFGVSPVEEGA
jgi:hypothetical protein